MEFLCFIVTRATHILTILVCWLMEALLKSSISVHLFDNSKFPHYELSSRWEGAGILVFKIWTKMGFMKKLFRNRALVKREGGSLREGVQIVSSVFLQKSMFSLPLEYFFFFFCLLNIHACCNQ